MSLILRVHACLSQEVAIGLAVIANPLGTFTPSRCQLAIHLAERGVLPANQRDIVNTDFVKPLNAPRHTAGRFQLRLVPQELAVSYNILVDSPSRTSL